MGTFQLLLLGLSVTMFLVTEGVPPGFTRAQWFNEQHVQYPKTIASNDNIYCNNEMRRINNHTSRCKSFNTFLNYLGPAVIKVCLEPNISCMNPAMQNCHNSTTDVPLTNCQLTSGRYPNCSYRGTSKQAYFVVACDPPVPADHSRSKLLPVHLDSTTSQPDPILLSL
ncbi:ribonuclease 8-like [Phascolarctos cinereus]|uniref:Ribonuclease K3-like n=1 Tax=Phascolarctos cinereus TaxID=38626 RepID=A0A6P5K441_PHACI|nr:ribonuclease K3-like [Phascolarctos cinereus]